MNLYEKIKSNALLKESEDDIYYVDFSKLTDDELLAKYKEIKSDVDYNDATGQWDNSYENLFKITNVLEQRGLIDLIEDSDKECDTTKRYLKEESYDEGIFLEIEEALFNAGLSVERYSNAGILSNNLGWVVSGSDGEVQLQCMGTYLSEKETSRANTFDESEEPETYEAVEEEIEKIRKQLDYCERRDAVCAAFGSDHERAELEARLVELSEKLDTWDGEKFVSECSLNESTRTFKLGDTIYWIGAGNEISTTGEVVDFPTEGRMTVKWDDGDVNTYDTTHPSIQHEDDYEEWLNESEFMKEAANPDNKEANKLIKKALSDAKFAYDNQDELKKLGISVEYDIRDSKKGSTVTSADDFMQCTLVGPKGRKLKCNTIGWSTSLPSAREMTDISNNYSDNDEENTIAVKDYAKSTEKVKNAKAELPTLKRRLNLYERRYGKDSHQYKELVNEIKTTKNTINTGIQPTKHTGYNQKPSADVDYKNYLDSTKIKDREKPYKAPKMNPTVARYKGAKSDEEYNRRWSERNKELDKEDQERIEYYVKKAAEEKTRRDSELARSKARTQSTLTELRARVDAMKARRNKQ